MGSLVFWFSDETSWFSDETRMQAVRRGSEGRKITLRPIRKSVKEHGILLPLAMKSHDFYLAQSVNQLN